LAADNLTTGAMGWVDPVGDEQAVFLALAGEVLSERGGVAASMVRAEIVQVAKMASLSYSR
jgi:hypothetical protein